MLAKIINKLGIIPKKVISLQKINDMASIIKKSFILLLLSGLFITAKANDGAFYSSGNQLIPIVETDIRVQKEVLKIKRGMKKNEDWDQSYFEVSVYYEFFNPSAAKDLIVGFEASPPSDGNNLDSYPNHPYIYDFKAVMNGEKLSYEVAHVPYQHDEDGQIILKKGGYYKNGRFQNLSLKECQNPPEIDGDYYDYEWFYYVYHFKAHFNEGLNIIEHTYRFDGTDDVMTSYAFNYVLTAANRWANNGIDDFTLEIDMGDRESFGIFPYFFKDVNEWTYSVRGRGNFDFLDPYEHEPDDPKYAVFHVQEGSIVFHKTNFHPDGELFLTKPNFYGIESLEDPFSRMYLDLGPDYYSLLGDKDDLEAEHLRIIKNLPFAYHGYVFKTKSLQKYFETTNWYVPNPDFKGTMNELDVDEREWVSNWSN